MTGRIFDIQRFSVHDGPGIRTTVFMKGCPLRCKWCHNPEGLSHQLQLQFFQEECLQCGRCGDRKHLTDADHCPIGALKVCGRDVLPEEVVEEAIRDRNFYGNEGGVTFSGGECLLQADFVAHTMTLLKQEGIHTVADTSGCVEFARIEKVLPVCDLFLYDVKHVDPEKHKRFTGADNRVILENLRRLSEMGVPVWVRVPVIPTFNDSVEEQTAIAEFVAEQSNVQQLTLMPYHTLGKSKYGTLGMHPEYDAPTQIQPEQMETFRCLYRERGLQLV